MSHGTAGNAWALAELARATGDPRFLLGARRALAYERSHFDAASGNWPDFRGPNAATEENGSSVAWCHGAAGIAMARLMVRPVAHGLGDGELDDGALDDGALDDEVKVALETTEAEGFGVTHCLCHGDLGNAELFQLASEAYDLPEWRSQALRRAKGVLLDEAQQGRWRTGTVNGTESPGLMDGLAGIGYGLLRLADPSRVPSVLVLEPPRAR